MIASLPCRPRIRAYSTRRCLPCRALCLLCLSALLGTAFPAAAAEDALPLKTLADLKAATVFLKVEDGREAASGTGFVIQTNGQTAYLVTNHHVVDLHEGKRGMPGGGAITITAVFGSGTKNERSARAEVLASDARRDLAVLRVQGVRELPPPIEYDHEPQLVETMQVYILGFPLGDLLATGKGNPAITVNKGSVSSIRLNDRGEVATVQIDGDITPGNSGGPVVDSRGRLMMCAPGSSFSTIGRIVAAPSTSVSSRARRLSMRSVKTCPRSKSAPSWISSIARKATSRSRGIASTVDTQ